MHGKAVAIAPPLSRLGISLVIPDALDTDRFGSFTGEVPRAGTMEDAARLKARAAAEATGLPVGLASEGAYGPHPVIPFLAAGVELILWHDTTTGHEVIERLTDEAPVYDRIEIKGIDDLAPFFARTRFPETALVVTPVGLGPKGVADPAALATAVTEAIARSPVARALVQTDMRAHMNPRRMETIGKLAERFATRLATPCPACGAPGWGLLRTEPGLPCAECDTPSALVRVEVYGCTACGHAETRPRQDGKTTADPANCPMCNP